MLSKFSHTILELNILSVQNREFKNLIQNYLFYTANNRLIGFVTKIMRSTIKTEKNRIEYISVQGSSNVTITWIIK